MPWAPTPATTSARDRRDSPPGRCFRRQRRPPHLADTKTAIEENGQTARSLDAAAEAFDTTANAEHGIPGFTAMYVTTSFATCFGQATIAAGQMVPDSEGCERDLGAEFHPCFDAGYVPVDCRSGELVVLRGGEWVDA